MLNIEKYKDEILKEYKDNLDIIDAISDSTSLGNALFSIYDRRNNGKELDIIEWLTSEYKEPILTDEEKIIIKDIIKVFEPFGKELSYISKTSWCRDSGKCYLYFKYEDDSSGIPSINSNELFVGMELDKSYTLEELGL